MKIMEVKFTVEFDLEGEIVYISRSCRMLILCENCPYKDWCDKVEKRIREDEDARKSN